MDPTFEPCNVTESTLTFNINISKGRQNVNTAFIKTIPLILYIIVFVLGTVGNGLVIYVTGYKMKTTVNSIWFLNLALADFLFTLSLILNIIYLFNSGWPFGLYICKLNTFLAVLNMFASIFLLTAISLDRCLSTWVIVWAQNKRTPNKARIACFFIWMSGIMCSVPFARYRQLSLHRNTTYCGTNASNEVRWNLAIFRFMMGFLIPFIIIICSYMAIGVRASRLQRQKKLKPIKVILTVILAFFLCWIPFHIHQLCTLRGKWSPNTKNVLMNMGPTLVSLAYLNSCLNPILYVFMCEEFKTMLKKSLLLVLENAFTEEHLGFLTNLHSSSRNSDILMKRNGTATDLISHLDKTTSSEG